MARRCGATRARAASDSAHFGFGPSDPRSPTSRASTPTLRATSACAAARWAAVGRSAAIASVNRATAVNNPSARESDDPGTRTDPVRRYSSARDRKPANSAIGSERNGSRARAASSTAPAAARPSPAASRAGTRLRRNCCRAATCMAVDFLLEFSAECLEGLADDGLRHGEPDLTVRVNLGRGYAERRILLDARVKDRNRIVPDLQDSLLQLGQGIGLRPDRLSLEKPDHIRHDSENGKLRAQFVSEMPERAK